MKRFKAESQDMAHTLWNVIDTKNSTYVKRLITHREAAKLVKELNRFSIRQFRNDLANFLYRVLHS